jgi:hypothetical protein
MCLAECNPARIAEVDAILHKVAHTESTEVELFSALCHKYQHVTHTNILRENLHFSIVAHQATRFFVANVPGTVQLSQSPTGPLYNVLDVLRDGVVLCRSVGVTPIDVADAGMARRYFAARDNIGRFVEACKSLLGDYAPPGIYFDGGEFHEGTKDDLIAHKLSVIAVHLYARGVAMSYPPPACVVYDSGYGMSGLKGSFPVVDPSFQIAMLRSELPGASRLNIIYRDYLCSISHPLEHPRPLVFSTCVLEGLVMMKHGAAWELAEAVMARYCQQWDGVKWSFRRPVILESPDSHESRPPSSADYRCQLMLETPNTLQNMTFLDPLNNAHRADSNQPDASPPTLTSAHTQPPGAAAFVQDGDEDDDNAQVLSGARSIPVAHGRRESAPYYNSLPRYGASTSQPQYSGGPSESIPMLRQPSDDVLGLTTGDAATVVQESTLSLSSTTLPSPESRSRRVNDSFGVQGRLPPRAASMQNFGRHMDPNISPTTLPPFVPPPVVAGRAGHVGQMYRSSSFTRHAPPTGPHALQRVPPLPGAGHDPVARGAQGTLRTFSRGRGGSSGSPSPSRTPQPTSLRVSSAALRQFPADMPGQFPALPQEQHLAEKDASFHSVPMISGMDDYTASPSVYSDGVDEPVSLMEFSVRHKDDSGREQTFRIAPSDQRSVVGRGAFGCVFHGVELSTLRSVAVKVIPLTASDSDLPASKIAEVTEEAALIASVSHENIVRCFGATVLDDRCLCLVMEFASGGTIKNLVERFAPLPHQVATRIVKEVTCALCAIHEAGLVHCDLKLENILLRDDGSVAIADFGCARAASVCEESAIVGTPQYMSPESINDPSTAFTTKRDVWALGCCAVTIFTGVLPWSHMRFESKIPMLFHIGNSHSERPFLDEVIATLPAVMRSIVVDCLEHDHNKRPDAAKLLPLLDL